MSNHTTPNNLRNEQTYKSQQALLKPIQLTFSSEQAILTTNIYTNQRALAADPQATNYCVPFLRFVKIIQKA